MCRKIPIYTLGSAEAICDERNHHHRVNGTAEPCRPLSVYYCEKCLAYHLGRQFDPRTIHQEGSYSYASAR